MSDDIDASVHLSGNVLIINFAGPISVAVDRLSAQAPDYIAAARRDPDGKAVRIGLARKLKVNSIVAGHKFFVDLMPDSWTAAPPSLPQDVIDELARRAREATRLERLERQAAQQKKVAPVRVHVATQPTFTRYVFALPDQTSVTADRAADRLTLVFDAPIKFDFGDAEAELPASIAVIKSEVEEASTLVRFSFAEKVDVRSFRDDQTYVVDVDHAPDKAGAKSGAAENATPGMIRAAAAVEKAAAESSAPAAPAPAPPPPPQEEPHVAPPATIAANAPEAPAAEMKAAPPAPQAPPPAPTPPQTAPPQAAPAAPSAPAAEMKRPVRATSAASRLSSRHAPAAPAATPAASAPTTNSADTVAVELSRQGVNLKLSFPFPTATAGAVFQRADTLWIVFDAKASSTSRRSTAKRPGPSAPPSSRTRPTPRSCASGSIARVCRASRPKDRSGP